MTSRSLTDLENLPLHGRFIETSALQTAVARVEHLKQPEVLFLRGASGSGKTRLAMTLREDSYSRYFITGKFDKVQSGRPYSAVVDALTDLCDQVAASKDDQLKEAVCSRLQEKLGSECNILRQALPNVDKILGTTSNDQSLYNESFAFDRLKISFRALVQAVMDTGTGMIVMFLDDLQWSDTETWDMMRDLTTKKQQDNSNQNEDEKQTKSQLLLIGAYRNDGVDQLPDLTNNLDEMAKVCTFQNIEIKDFDTGQLNGLVASILNMNKERTVSLANAIHVKTAGNPHFSLQFMKALEKQKLLVFSMDNFCWEWYVEKIQSDTDIGDNLVEIFVAKIDSLKTEARTALIIGSCLGSKFDMLVVESLLTTINGGDIRDIAGRDQLMNALELASKEGLVDRQRGSSLYRFVHDKIHQAFYSLIPEISNADELHLKIGKALLDYWKEASPQQDWLTFLSTNQLNLGSHLIKDGFETVELAKMNLASAKAAMKASAYRPASEYLRKAMALVDHEGWSHYDLRLELTTLMSRTEFCLGNFTECHKAVNEVIRNAHTAREKIPVFRVCVDAFGAESRVFECLVKGSTFVKQLGVKLPRKYGKVSLIMAFTKTKKMMKGKSDEALLNYPLATDETKIAAVRILNTMVTFAVHARKMEEALTIALINTQLILAHGFTDEAGSILAAYGNVVAWTGELTKGHSYGQIALQLAGKMKAGIPRTFMNYYGALDHLKNPLHQSTEPLLRGYRVAFEVGDTMYGFYCSFLYLTIFFFVGYPLKTLLRDTESFRKEMTSYNVQSTIDLLKSYHQTFINLTSDTETPTMLNGAAMVEEEELRSGVPQAIECVWWLKLTLGLFFDDYAVTRENLKKIAYERPPDADGCMFHANVLMWTEAFGAYIVAGKTNKRKYHNLAKNRVKRIEKWVKKGNVNCHHFLLHLYAERAVCHKKPLSEVKRLYDAAIAASRRAGFINTAAIANERAARFFIAQDDMEWAKVYMMSAFELYNNWGASTKCSVLLNTHGDLLFNSTRGRIDFNSSAGSSGTAHKGRKRHTSILGKMHRGESIEFEAANNSQGDISGPFSLSFSQIAEESSRSMKGCDLDAESMPSHGTSTVPSTVPSIVKDSAAIKSKTARDVLFPNIPSE